MKDMAQDTLGTLMVWGLQALKSGGETAKAATAEIEGDAKNPGLKAALRQGNATAARWAQRIERALAEAEPTKDVGNPILEAHYDYSRQIRRGAPDDLTRDLGIISAGQLALHYWIGSFGTLRAYASTLGQSQVAQDMEACLEEAKEADREQTGIAEALLGARG